MNRITDLLNSLHAKGITLWVENGALRHAAPVQPLSAEEWQSLETCKADIIGFYEQSPPTTGTPSARLPCEPVPETSQQRTFNKGMLEPNHLKCHFIGSAVRLIGSLNVEVLSSSIAAAIRRHEALRTHVRVEKGVADQHVYPPSGFDRYELETVELRGDPIDTEAQARRLGRAFISDPARCQRGLSFRAQLLKLADDDHVLVFCADHMVMDGFSMGIVTREIFVLYRAFAQNKPCPLPKVDLHYADYAVWQRKHSAAWQAQHGAYWQERMAGARQALWPVDEGITGVEPYNSTSYQLSIDAALTSQLRQAAKRHSTTLPRIMLAIHAVLVAHTTRSRDTVVGFSSLGRNHSRLVGLVGFLAHTLCLRIQLPDDVTLLDALQLTQRELTAASEHSDFGQTSRTRLELSPGGMYQFVPWASSFTESSARQDQPQAMKDGAGKPGLKISRFSIDPYSLPVRPSPHFHNPRFVFSEGAEGISGVCFYRADLFRKTTLERFARNLDVLANQFVDDPGVLLAACPLEAS